MYTAFVIDLADRVRLSEVVRSVCPVDKLGFQFKANNYPLPHHLTLNLGAFDSTLNDASALEARGELVIDAFCLDETLGVCAARVARAVVRPDEGEFKLRSTNEHPHVTMCLRPGTKPAISNKLPWEHAELLVHLPAPITVAGQVEECS